MLILDPGVHIENPLLSTCSGSLPNNQTGPPAPHTLSHIISNYMPYKEATGTEKIHRKDISIEIGQVINKI